MLSAAMLPSAFNLVVVAEVDFVSGSSMGTPRAARTVRKNSSCCSRQLVLRTPPPPPVALPLSASLSVLFELDVMVAACVLPFTRDRRVSDVEVVDDTGGDGGSWPFSSSKRCCRELNGWRFFCDVFLQI